MADSSDSGTKSGVIYLARVPPLMKPQKMRHIFSQFGEVGHLFLQPEDEKHRKRRIKEGGSRKLRFTEGWVELKDKKVAKVVASSLNNTQMGGKKGSMYYDDLWTMKYLKGFSWSDLTAKLNLRAASAEKRSRSEYSQVKREKEAYQQRSDMSKALAAMSERKQKRKAGSEDGSADGPGASASSSSTSPAGMRRPLTFHQGAPAAKRAKPRALAIVCGAD